MTFTTHRVKLLSGEMALAVVFLVVGLVLSSAGLWYYGAVFLLVALLRGFTSNGVEFNFNQRRFRYFYAVLGLKMGGWQALPAIGGVRVRYFSEFISYGRMGQRRTDKLEALLVLLEVPRAPRGIVLGRFELKDKAVAMELGQVVAERIGVSLHVEE